MTHTCGCVVHLDMQVGERMGLHGRFCVRHVAGRWGYQSCLQRRLHDGRPAIGPIARRRMLLVSTTGGYIIRLIVKEHDGGSQQAMQASRGAYTSTPAAFAFVKHARALLRDMALFVAVPAVGTTRSIAPEIVQARARAGGEDPPASDASRVRDIAAAIYRCATGGWLAGVHAAGTRWCPVSRRQGADANSVAVPAPCRSSAESVYVVWQAWEVPPSALAWRAGVRPFAGGTSVEVAARQRSCDINPHPNISPRTMQVLRMMLAHNPQDRMTAEGLQAYMALNNDARKRQELIESVTVW